MPILKLLSHLKTKYPTVAQTKTYKQYNGKLIAIDASKLIHKAFVNEMLQKPILRRSVNEQGNKNAHLSAIISKAIICKTNRIKPVWVFDGIIPMDKFKVQMSRTAYSPKATLKINKLMKSGKKEQALKYRKMNKAMTDDEIKSAIKLLGLLGYPVVSAPAEALAQCAYLNKSGEVYAVAAEDDNLFPLGGKIMMKSFKAGKQFTQVTLQPFIKQNNFTEDQLIDICIINGCNYSLPLQGVGVATSIKYINEFKTIEKILPQLKLTQQKQTALKTQFDFIRARKLFKYPDIVRQDNPFKFKQIQYQRLKQFLISEGFEQSRISRWLVFLQLQK